MSKTKVSIIGGAGYGSAELLRHLLVRQDVEVCRISSKDYVGQPISRVHKNLTGFDHLVLEDISPKECSHGVDLVFLAMPHIATAKVAMELFDLGVRIIDLSGDFRLKNHYDYQRDYSREHPCPQYLGRFVYGMPEINTQQIIDAKYLANPGCFATAINLGLLPLASAGLLKNTGISNVSMTGSSGSGIKPQAGTHHALRANNLKAYKILHHQHHSEILQTLSCLGATNIALDFVPVSVPLVRGILAISQLDLPQNHNTDTLQALYESYYEGQAMISVLSAGESPEVISVAGTVRAEIGITIREDEATGVKTLCCISAIDNLIKGCAGQAIQNFNLMVGKPLNYGLDKPGLWP